MLSAFNNVLMAQSEARARERKEFNDKLEAGGGPLFFIPDPDEPAHGVGWFRGDVGFFSYRRYSNGYDPNSRFVLTDEFLHRLVPHLPKKPRDPGRYDGG